MDDIACTDSQDNTKQKNKKQKKVREQHMAAFLSHSASARNMIQPCFPLPVGPEHISSHLVFLYYFMSITMLNLTLAQHET